MTVAPQKYPRIPHVARSAAVTSDDAVLAGPDLRALLEREVVVEEKLDGMNVVIWVDAGRPLVGTRGGPETSDRSGERGRVRAWAMVRADALARALGERYALYGEWLLRRHGVAYDRLPSELVGLDVADRRTGGFLDVDERDAVLADAGVPPPPCLFRGRLDASAGLEGLLGRSAFGTERAEGVVIRAVDGPRQVAKLVAPEWSRIGMTEWQGENRLAS